MCSVLIYNLSNDISSHILSPKCVFLPLISQISPLQPSRHKQKKVLFPVTEDIVSKQRPLFLQGWFPQGPTAFWNTCALKWYDRQCSFLLFIINTHKISTCTLSWQYIPIRKILTPICYEKHLYLIDTYDLETILEIIFVSSI